MKNIIKQHITITPGLRSGKPHIIGNRITVSDVAILHLKMGQTVPEIAAEYDLPLASIYAALAYYYDNKAEIEAEIANSAAFVEASKPQAPSKLQAKLSQLRDYAATSISS